MTITYGAAPGARTVGRLVVAAIAAAIGSLVAIAAVATPARAAEAFVGVDTAGQLMTFSSERPERARRRALTGLPAGETIVGLDVRPATRELYALSSASRIYTLDVATAAVTAVGSAPFVPALDGRSFGFDFNPTVDRIRVTAETRQNLRLNPITGANAAIDGRLAYAAGDPGAGSTPIVVPSAYNNSVANATVTELYGIDVARDVLVEQNPPNPGTLITEGALGVNATSPVSYDIAPASGLGYATFRAARTRGTALYRINEDTGRATALGKFRGAAVRAMAIRGTLP